MTTAHDGITGIDGANYIVCDSCGWLWDIDQRWKDPTYCPRCREARPLWRFPTLEPASNHSHLIEDRARERRG
jgi:hypothetical protein